MTIHSPPEPEPALHDRATYAASRCYVLKLHRDAAPERGELRGRVEHIASGAQAEFADASGLCDWIRRHGTSPGVDGVAVRTSSGESA